MELESGKLICLGLPFLRSGTSPCLSLSRSSIGTVTTFAPLSRLPLMYLALRGSLGSILRNLERIVFCVILENKVSKSLKKYSPSLVSVNNPQEGLAISPNRSRGEVRTSRLMFALLNPKSPRMTSILTRSLLLPLSTIRAIINKVQRSPNRSPRYVACLMYLKCTKVFNRAKELWPLSLRASMGTKLTAI